jgi:hypothetical protein
MTSSALYRLLALFNIVVLSVLVLDTYVLNQTTHLQIYDHSSSELTRTSVTRSYWSYFIHAKSGEKYQVPENTNMDLSYNDSFYVNRSYLFRKPLSIIYPVGDDQYILYTGLLNSNLFSHLVAAFILVVSFINLLPITLIKGPNLREKLIFSSTSILVVLVVFYFW